MARSKKDSIPAVTEEKEVIAEAPAVETAVEAAPEEAVSKPVIGELNFGDQGDGAPKAASPESIQSEIREKLTNRNVSENAFVPTMTKSLESAAEQISKEMEFDWNRGTAVGARLMARARKLK